MWLRWATEWRVISVGFVVVTTDAPIVEILRFVRSQLPSYMVPGRIVPVSDLPMTVNGRWTGPRCCVRRTATTLHGATQMDDFHELEVQVSQIWADVLGHRHFDRDTRFFDAGGSSRTAAQRESRGAGSVAWE